MKVLNILQIESEKIASWLDVARWAPSGGNSQPWVAEIGGESFQLALSIDPSYIDQKSPLDESGFASVIALGCLAKNLEIIAGSDGYLTKITFSEHATVWNTKVFFQFYKTTAPAMFTPLDKSIILSRVTDRNLYSKETIPIAFLLEVESLMRKARFVEFIFADQKPHRLLPQLTAIETILWKNKTFLESRLEEIDFRKTDLPPEKRIAVNQLGLHLLDQWIFKFIAKSKVIRSLFVLFFYRVAISKGLKKNLLASGGIGFFQTKDESFASTFELGQIFQNVWLLSEKYALGFQPISSFLAVLSYWQNPNGNLFSANEIQTIQQVTKETREKSTLDLTKTVLGFRVGHPLVKPLRSGRAAFKIISKRT